MPDHLKKATYEAAVNDTFKVSLDDDNSLEVTLKGVFAGAPPSPQYESFSIEFQGPPEVLLPQRIYELSHEKLGTFTLFLVPVESTEAGYVYEAVFNVKKSES